MSADLAERHAEQRLAGLQLVPRRCAARVREGDDVELDAMPPRADDRADERIQLLGGGLLAEHLGDRERADREHELGPEDRNLALEERATARDLVEVGLAIAAPLRL